MARYALNVALLALMLSVVPAAKGPSILKRYDEASTNILGLRLNRLLLRIPEFADLITPASNETSSAQERGPVYPVLVVEPTNETATSSLIVLHGMDSHPEQLKIIATFARELLPRTRFVIPRAPVADVTYLGRNATSWFNVFKRLPGQENRTELLAAAAGVTRLVREEKRRHNISSDRVVVLGMSQGGAVALAFYLAEEIKVAGVIAAATWLPLPTYWKKNTLAAANGRTKLLMVHGGKDAVIPIAEAKSSMANLKNLGRSVQFIEYPTGGHTLAEAASKLTEDLSAFVAAQLGSG